MTSFNRMCSYKRYIIQLLKYSINQFQWLSLTIFVVVIEHLFFFEQEPLSIKLSLFSSNVCLFHLTARGMSGVHCKLCDPDIAKQRKEFIVINGREQASRLALLHWDVNLDKLLAANVTQSINCGTNVFFNRFQFNCTRRRRRWKSTFELNQ